MMKPKKNDALARRARIADERWRTHFNQNIDLYHLMHEFVLGQQWSQEEEDDMIKTYRKVPMTSNKLGTMANSLLGEQQQNTPQLEVIPMTGCDEQTAHLREIIVKDIMFSTPAKTAYQVAASQAGIGGFGAFLIDTDYVHEKSFDLDIVYRYFKDATRCYWDVAAEDINKTDGDVCGFRWQMSRTRFRMLYGRDMEDDIVNSSNLIQSREEVALMTEPNESANPWTWVDNESITLIDHYERESKKDMLYKLSNGRTVDQAELDELIDRSAERMEQRLLMEPVVPEMPQDDLMPPPEGAQGFGSPETQELLPETRNAMPAPLPLPEPEEPSIEEDLALVSLYDGDELVRIVGQKEVKRFVIKHYRIAGEYVLDESEFPADRLPLVFVDNNSYYNKAGKQVTRSFFGDCRDTQRYINYLRTQSAYILKVSRYDQWIGSKKNVASLDTQRNWRDPTAIQGMLTYDESPEGYKPEQIRPPELSASLFQQYQLAVEDLYTSTGLYPSRMGQQGNEVSGAAIDARTRQGSYSTYVFFNSINRAIAAGGEIVNEMIPKVYDSERVLTLMMPDTGIQNITVNKQVDAYGEVIENDIRKGTYQVRLRPGASYEGQKEQALQSLQQVLQADPTSWSLIADLYAENLPLPNTIEIKNRLKTRVPADIIEAGKTGELPPQANQPNPELMALQLQQQQAQQQAAFKAQELQLKQQELELERQEILMEAQAKLQELENERLKTAAELKEQELRYMAETERTASDQQIAHADNLIKLLTHKL